MINQQQQLIENTTSFVKTKLKFAEPGHDWWHALRVWKLSKKIIQEEQKNKDFIFDDQSLIVIELAALLHDIADAKFHDGNEEIGSQITHEFLSSQGVSEEIINHVKLIVKNISYKGGEKSVFSRTIAFDIVQDADRLDALGAIGIARAFSYGGNKNRVLYDPTIPPLTTMTKDEYRKSNAPTINHFYEKLFKLKDLMNTPTGKALAIKRHQFMESFVDEFINEWETSS